MAVGRARRAGGPLAIQELGGGGGEPGCRPSARVPPAGRRQEPEGLVQWQSSFGGRLKSGFEFRAAVT
jgi:hypothetical protein